MLHSAKEDQSVDSHTLAVLVYCSLWLSPSASVAHSKLDYLL